MQSPCVDAVFRSLRIRAEQRPALHVAVTIYPPFVMKRNGSLTGFSIDATYEGKGRVKMVAAEFNSGPVAILVQLDSPLRRKINGALLALRENGTYQQLYTKWFGAP